MLANLYSRQRSKYSRSPVSEWLESFALWTEASGYLPYLIRGHVYRLRLSLEKSPLGPMGTARVSKSRLQELFATKEKQKTIHFAATRRLFQRFLEHLGSILSDDEPDHPFFKLIEDYCTFLRELRGYVPETIQCHRSTVSRLLSQGIFRENGLSALTSDTITRFVHQESTRQGRYALQHTVAHLRSFLDFCNNQGKLSSPPTKIDTPRIYQGERPPRAIPWSLIKKLLHSIDRMDKGGWRDYTMLHLTACYGLRPSEIASLSVDSIDWTIGTLRVDQRKTHSTLVLPLHRTTLGLIRRYMIHYRPQTGHSELFLRVRTPWGALRAETVGLVYQKRARLSGLPLDKTSLYSLRHSFAMRLLGRGVGIKEIGDFMGHHALESTLVYLRLQTESLREAALSLPDLSMKGEHNG